MEHEIKAIRGVIERKCTEGKNMNGISRSNSNLFGR